MKKVTELRPNLRDELDQIIKSDPGMSQESTARQIGTSGTTVSRYLKGEYGGNVAELERKISNFIRSFKQRTAENKALPSAPEWIETPTAADIISTLEYAQIASDVVVVYGGAGLGKTKSIEHFSMTRPNVWVITACPATEGVVPALEALADALDIPISNGAARLHRAIVKRMQGSFGLLVVDEAQNLNVKALDQMRSIHDATGCGLALVGNDSTYSQLTGGTRAPYLDRLYSRVGKKLRVGKATRADVDAVIEGWEVELKGCKGLLRKIAGSDGSLRSLTKTMRLASMYAAGEKRAVNCTDVSAAWEELGGAA